MARLVVLASITELKLKQGSKTRAVLLAGAVWFVTMLAVGVAKEN